MKKNFNPYDNIKNQQRSSFQQPQYRIPTVKDFLSLFTKLDLLSLFLFVIGNLLIASPVISVFIKSFSMSLIFIPKFILLMVKVQKYGQPIRDYGPQTHLVKKNTPTMGGLFIIIFSIIFSLSYCNTHLIYIPILALIFYGVLGFYDDFLKLKKNDSKGFGAKQKLLIQFVLGFILSLLIYNYNHDLTKIYIPFYGLLDITIWLFIPLGTATIVSTCNALNLTDGLDGLAISQFFIIITFLISVSLGLTIHAGFINDIFYTKELAKFLAITIGVGGSFFWFNSFPARIFMGDVGSLALGSVIGVTALLLSIPLVLIVSGIIMVIEGASVIIQIYSYKRSGGKKRFFLMAPIHHHFEKLGFHENQITQAMFIISIIFNLIASQI